jgi:hypothetical protein
MNKSLLFGVFLVLFLIPALVYLPAGMASAQGIVQCGNTGQPPCQIQDFFAMLGRIYNFIVLYIAAPLAVLGLTIGGIFLLISAGNPNLAGQGKKIIWMSIIGLVLAFGSWLIIKTILGAIGYKYSF